MNSERLSFWRFLAMGLALGTACFGAVGGAGGIASGIDAVGPGWIEITRLGVDLGVVMGGTVIAVSFGGCLAIQVGGIAESGRLALRRSGWFWGLLAMACSMSIFGTVNVLSYVILSGGGLERAGFPVEFLRIAGFMELKGRKEVSFYPADIEFRLWAIAVDWSVGLTVSVLLGRFVQRSVSKSGRPGEGGGMRGIGKE